MRSIPEMKTELSSRNLKIILPAGKSADREIIADTLSENRIPGKNHSLYRMKISVFFLIILQLIISKTAFAGNDMCLYASVAALKTEMMVASLSCHTSTSYNIYIRRYRAVFLLADRSLKTGFGTLHPGYDEWITELANFRSIQRNAAGDSYCHDAELFLKSLSAGKESPVAAASRLSVTYPSMSLCHKD